MLVASGILSRDLWNRALAGCVTLTGIVPHNVRMYHSQKVYHMMEIVSAGCKWCAYFIAGVYIRNIINLISFWGPPLIMSSHTMSFVSCLHVFQLPIPHKAPSCPTELPTVQLPVLTTYTRRAPRYALWIILSLDTQQGRVNISPERLRQIWLIDIRLIQVASCIRR